MLRASSLPEIALSEIAALLARGYLRLQVGQSTVAGKLNLTSVSTCLDLTPRIVVSVPGGELSGEAGGPQTQLDEEAEQWQWM